MAFKQEASMHRIQQVLLLALMVLMIGAKAEAVTVFSANLTIGQEPTLVGPTTTTGAPRPIPFGTAVFVLNDLQTALAFTATIFNIDVTGTQTADINDNLVAAHIHAGTGATPTFPVVWGFFGSPFNNNNPPDEVDTPFSSGVGGTFSGTWNAPEGNNTTLTAQLANILAGRSYINFHTVQNSGGEIRGPILPAAEPSMGILLGVGVLMLGYTLRHRVHE
jgi:hypothetical protein